MQWAYYTTARDMEQLVKESRDPDFTRNWRYFQISDHLYYMFTAGGAPGEVHSYFSPYGNPIDAFVTCQSALADFEMRLRLFTVAAKEPFKFYSGVGEKKYIGVNALSLKGFIDAVSKMNTQNLEFHNGRGDFESWAKFSLSSKELADEFREISKSELEGEELRAAIAKTAKKHFAELHKKTQDLGYY